MLKSETKPTEKLIETVTDFLWEYLTKDPENIHDRVQTGWGTKTEEGLAACILRIVEDFQKGGTA